jgi:hypothetical protein
MDELFKDIYARDLLLNLAETDEALAYWETADDADMYETLEAMGYEWHKGGWYTPEFLASQS